jgi:hypothetical protein
VSTTIAGGFPIYSQAFGDLHIGGFNDADDNELVFDMPQNWSDSFTVSTATTFALGLLNT